jgi:hypothetical protein
MDDLAWTWRDCMPVFTVCRLSLKAARSRLVSGIKSFCDLRVGTKRDQHGRICVVSSIVTEVVMKASGLIFLGLCLLPSGVLIGSPGLFGFGSVILLAGNLKLLMKMRHEMEHPVSDRPVLP